MKIEIEDDIIIDELKLNGYDELYDALDDMRLNDQARDNDYFDGKDVLETVISYALKSGLKQIYEELANKVTNNEKS